MKIFITKQTFLKSKGKSDKEIELLLNFPCRSKKHQNALLNEGTHFVLYTEQSCFNTYFAGAAVVFVAIVRVALARALTVAFRRTPPTVSWGQPSTDSGRRTGFLPLTKYLPITIHMLKTRETDKPAVAP